MINFNLLFILCLIHYNTVIAQDCNCNILKPHYETNYNSRLVNDGYIKYSKISLNSNECPLNEIKLECNGDFMAYFYVLNNNYSLNDIKVSLVNEHREVIAENFHNGNIYKAFSFKFYNQFNGFIKLHSNDDKSNVICIDVVIYVKYIGN